MLKASGLPAPGGSEILATQMERKASASVKHSSLPLGQVQSPNQKIMEAALSLFQERGFYGTSLRDISARSGMSVSHLYYYFPSKASVLKELMSQISHDLIAVLEKAEAEAGDPPTQRLKALVQAQVLFHSRRQAEAFVGRSELRSLEGDDRTEIIILYDRVSSMFAKAISDGVKQGEFVCPFVSEATKAIITMCNGVSTWYRPEGRLTPKAIAQRYVELSLAMVRRKVDNKS